MKGRRMHRLITIILILVITCSLCICVHAQDLTELQEQSSQLTQAIDESNNRLQAVQGELSTNMQELQDLDNQIAQSQNELNNINTDINDLMKQISENEDKLKNTQAQFDKIQGLLDARIIKMYETPKFEFLQVILASKNVTEFLSTYYAMKELAEYDKELLDTVRKQKEDIETTKKILAEKKKQVVTSKQSQQKKAQVLANTKTMRQYYISKLSTEEQELQAKIDDYNNQVETIEAEIKLMALNSVSADYIGGALTWPIPGYNTITSEFGMRVHPITGAYKLHTGTDIGAPMGADFVAMAKGVVTKASMTPAYGNMVIIDHGGGVQTLYAHGSEILVQVGQEVEAGTPVLKVGSTGYSTGPHAHFEIRINGQPVNPMDYLLNKDELQKITQKNENNQEETNVEE